ncbi:MAG TPA: aminotransferase class I/II-fold pyridoxal phosphate-dependent enzyme, partial [Pyrinomonadaceae bacterium]|nr:aminotransferase class I/II-fold pyridoxal phosphate-dependent enzyme [Pyrinomonadaceae bacterium]
MTSWREVTGSSYMHWAKTQSVARFNLATSGLGNLSLRDLRGVSLDDLELTSGGYGYKPLKQALAARYRVDVSSIVTAAGTSFANHLAIAALIEPGDEVLFEEPAYEPMLATALYLGADIKRFQRNFEDEFQVSAKEIDALATERTRLIVL